MKPLIFDPRMTAGRFSALGLWMANHPDATLDFEPTNDGFEITLSMEGDCLMATFETGRQDTAFCSEEEPKEDTTGRAAS